MTLNAVMLSLGPSLTVPGPVLTDLMDKRSELFVDPPPLSGTETAHSIVDFGSNIITLPSLPVPLMEPQSLTMNPVQTEEDLKVLDKENGSLRLLNKPSINRLFGSGLGSKKSSVESMRSTKANPTSPKIELVVSNSTVMPSFERKKETSGYVVEDLQGDQITAPKIAKSQSDTTPARASLPLLEGSRSISTPIADIYQGTSSYFPTLRLQKSVSDLSMSTNPPAPNMTEPQIHGLAGNPAALAGSTNPSTVIRRGPPVFFQSSGTNEKHVRTPDGGPIGIKRKDDSPPQSSTSSGIKGIDPARVKRLSAGPGSMSVRDVVRTMEMTA